MTALGSAVLSITLIVNVSQTFKLVQKKTKKNVQLIVIMDCTFKAVVPFLA